VGDTGGRCVRDTLTAPPVRASAAHKQLLACRITYCVGALARKQRDQRKDVTRMVRGMQCTYSFLRKLVRLQCTPRIPQRPAPPAPPAACHRWHVEHQHQCSQRPHPRSSPHCVCRSLPLMSSNLPASG